MRKTILFLLMPLWMISCKRKQPTVVVTATASAFVTRDSGNKMIGSYLNSINYTTNDTDIRSIIVDADLLRKYLDSAANSSQIKQVKISMAHTLEYINSGKGNEYAGYRSGALTIVISGVDASGNYVFFPDGLVIDRAESCPSNCPPGTAGNSLLNIQLIR